MHLLRDHGTYFFFSKVNAKEAAFLVLMAELVKSSFFHFTIEPPFSEDPLMHLGA